MIYKDVEPVLAACLGYGAATRVLVDRGAVVTAENNHGRTARDIAEERRPREYYKGDRR